MIVVVNGGLDWSPWFLGMKVHQTWLGRSRWFLQDGRLWIVDRAGTWRPEGILWRLGAVKPEPMHRACLEMIRMAGVPCVNPAATLLRGYDRLGMLAELKLAGLPVVDFDVVAGHGALELARPALPAVVKMDNFHGGMAKARALDEGQWDELVNLATPYFDYATVEPFVDYQADVRCLAVGERMWAMERRSPGWKANVDTDHHRLIEPPEALAGWTRQAMAALGADVLGLDFLVRDDGSAVLLESNDIPGVMGFPEEVRVELAKILRTKMS